MSKSDNSDILDLISLKDGNQNFCLELFQNTSLRDTVYIKVNILEECLKFGAMNAKPNMYYWKYSDAGTQNFTKVDFDDRLTIRDLIQDCEEMREYCKRFGYSSYIV